MPQPLAAFRGRGARELTDSARPEAPAASRDDRGVDVGADLRGDVASPTWLRGIICGATARAHPPQPSWLCSGQGSPERAVPDLRTQRLWHKAVWGGGAFALRVAAVDDSCAAGCQVQVLVRYRLRNSASSSSVALAPEVTAAWTSRK